MRIARLWLVPVFVLFFGAACSGGSGGSKASPSCTGPCPHAVAAKCSLGPPDESQCESGCAQIRASSCGPKWDALFSCGGNNPQFKCDSNGYVTIVGCQTQSDALYSCLGGGGGQMDAATNGG